MPGTRERDLKRRCRTTVVGARMVAEKTERNLKRRRRATDVNAKKVTAAKIEANLYCHVKKLMKQEMKNY